MQERKDSSERIAGQILLIASWTELTSHLSVGKEEQSRVGRKSGRFCLDHACVKA
jgi:hypothetical protein